MKFNQKTAERKKKQRYYTKTGHKSSMAEVYGKLKYQKGTLIFSYPPS
jgi:hypothetical protein